MKNKLRVSTSTNICNHVLWNWNEEVYTSEESIQVIADAGFEAIDLDLSFWAIHRDRMAEDDWRIWLDKQIETAQAVKLPMTQSHAHFFSLDHCEQLSCEEQERRCKLIQRDIEASALCGIPWVVVHPQSYSDDKWYSPQLSMEKNLELFKRLGDHAAKYGVGLAIENMFIHSIPCFAASSDDLVELVDRLGDDKVFGICWDTGHANINKVDQPAALLQMGKRLKSLHINDNKGERDEHILPYHGSIAWEPFMKVLGAIGYEGDFTYEIHNFTKGFDKVFHREAAAFSRKLGQYMLTLM